MNSSTTAPGPRLNAALAQVTVLLPVAAALAHAGDRVVARVRHEHGARGASAVEWVVISAIIVTIVLAVGATLYTRLNDKASELDLTTP